MNDASSAVIAAAILAGGDSQRMGEDKAALGDGGASLIERQVKDLRDLSQSLPIFICSGSRRYEALNTYDVQHVPDALNSAGPLAGVAKALETALVSSTPDEPRRTVVLTHDAWATGIGDCDGSQGDSNHCRYGHKANGQVTQVKGWHEDEQESR